MNEITFILALLYEKRLITKDEAIKLRKVAVEQSLSNNLHEMQRKIQAALEKKSAKLEVQEISAKELV